MDKADEINEETVDESEPNRARAADGAEITYETVIEVQRGHNAADERAAKLLRHKDNARLLLLDGVGAEESKRAFREFCTAANEEARAMPAIRLAVGMGLLRSCLLELEGDSEASLEQAVNYLGENLVLVWPVRTRLPPFTVVRAAGLYIDALERYDEKTGEIRKLLKQHMEGVESVRPWVDRLTS
jgi:hypothetical protein